MEAQKNKIDKLKEFLKNKNNDPVLIRSIKEKIKAMENNKEVLK